MSHARLVVATLLLLGLLAPACTSTDEATEEQLYLPTEAEARANAEKSINDDNADEELERLMQEIEAEGK